MKEFRKIKSLKFLYEINEDGILRNVKSKKVINGYIEKNGYVRVRIENKCLNGVIRTTIHRLVAEAFIPNPENKPFVNHIDLDKQNNSVTNLEWVTHSENMKHAYKNGVNTTPLREHSVSQRKKITNGICEFESISNAGRYLVKNKKTTNLQSGIAGISAVLHNRRKTFGGFEWKFI